MPTPGGTTTSTPGAPSPPVLPATYRSLGPPDIEGEVIDTNQVSVAVQRKTSVARGLAATILLFSRPLVLLTIWLFAGRRPNEYRTVHLIRVKRSDGTIGQARIEADILGATAEAGDFVSIWGTQRSGVLVLKQGFNHTVGGEILVEGSRSSVIGKSIRVVVILTLILLVIAMFSR